MATRLSRLLNEALPDLRFEPTSKRVTARLGDEVVAVSDGAVLVWEPRRVVPVYAVPRDDVRAELVAPGDDDPAAPPGHGPVFPNVPFAVHTTPGTAYDVRTAAGAVPRGAFVPDDADLAGYVVLDDAAFTWAEEAEAVDGHPRDPFHRVDVRRGDREVTVRVGGTVVARSRRPLVLFETNIPPRYYLPREDVLVDLAPTATTSTCPYKGHASYWSATVDGVTVEDVAWSYESPYPDAVAIAGAVAFYPDRTQLEVG